MTNRINPIAKEVQDIFDGVYAQTQSFAKNKSSAINGLLVTATVEKDMEALKFGLDKGGDVDQTNSYGNTLLELAITGDWHEGADYLLYRGANGAVLGQNNVPLILLAAGRLAEVQARDPQQTEGWLDLCAKVKVLFPQVFEGEQGTAIESEFWRIVPGEYHGAIHQKAAEYAEIQRQSQDPHHQQ